MLSVSVCSRPTASLDFSTCPGTLSVLQAVTCCQRPFRYVCINVCVSGTSAHTRCFLSSLSPRRCLMPNVCYFCFMEFIERNHSLTHPPMSWLNVHIRPTFIDPLTITSSSPDFTSSSALDSHITSNRLINPSKSSNWLTVTSACPPLWPSPPVWQTIQASLLSLWIDLSCPPERKRMPTISVACWPTIQLFKSSLCDTVRAKPGLLFAACIRNHFFLYR